jgi:hypothetical protein
MKHILSFLFSLASIEAFFAQSTLVTYAGGPGNETFYDVMQLSDRRFLVAGAADNLDWLPANCAKILLPDPGITNNAGSGKTAFLAVLSADLSTIQEVCHLPPGAAENFRFIKTTNLPGAATGDIFVSGNTEDTQNGGYFIGKLNGNFVNSTPDGFSWVANIKAAAGQYPDIYQPWDVGSDGKVIYAYGDSHNYNWSAIYRLDADGNDEVVPEWRVHWPLAGGEFYGNAADYPEGAAALKYSAIIFKRDAGRCELRSTSYEDYNLWQPDGNGGTKKGKWPLDVLFDSPCIPGAPGNTTNGPGYTGYSPAATFTYGPSSVCIDRRNNHFYIGFNAKSVLPGGQPDFEPAVMAMEANGALKWWSRLYHEVRPDGSYRLSEPDQYVDALAIDYAASESVLVVGARCHGNNVENLWEGNEIQAHPGASGFQNRFTGNSGNIHISWLGKLRTDDGTLLHSTYMAEYAEGSGAFGAPHPDPNLDNWPNPNDGWPNVNTTYLTKNVLKTTSTGAVAVLGTGRRTITTANAFQKMVKPSGSGLSCWNAFVRMYTPGLEKPLYSSLLVGQWDTLTQDGGDNVQLFGLWKTAEGLIVVGKHKGVGAEIPLANVPSWGAVQYQGESAVLAHLTADNIYNPDDGPQTLFSGHLPKKPLSLKVTPNPANESVSLAWNNADHSARILVLNSLQQKIMQFDATSATSTLHCNHWAPGIYWIFVQTGQGQAVQKLVIAH